MKPILVESFLTPAEAQTLLARVRSLPWTRGKFMGRAVPREEVWMGPYAYKFSGRTLVPAAWTREIEAIRDKISARFGAGSGIFPNIGTPHGSPLAPSERRITRGADIAFADLAPLDLV